MNNLEFQLRGVGDPRLAVHATSALPAWLWSIDGTRILWANPVGARVFGAANGAALAEKTFGPADSHRRQVAQLAGRLSPSGAVRLERLRGFGARLGTLVTCGCARLDFADGSHGVLVAAAEPVGRAMPLVERLQRLVEGIDTPIAAFGRDGMFIGASDAARALLGFHDLSKAGLGQARSDALKQGRVELPVGIGHLVLQRVGTGADIGLVALIATGATPAAHSRTIPSILPAPAPPLEPVRAPIATAVVQTASDETTATSNDARATSSDAPATSSDAPATSSDAAAETVGIDEATPAPLDNIQAASAQSPPQPAPGYEQPALLDEAPAEFALTGDAPALPPEATEPAAAEPAAQPAPDYAQPALSAEVPAEFALIDEFAESPVAPPGPEATSDAAPPSLSHDGAMAAASSPEAPPETLEPAPEAHREEPSPDVEAVADEPASSPPAAPAAEPFAPAIEDVALPSAALPPVRAPSWLDEPLPAIRQHPLRFMWQMDADGRFSIGSDEFTRLIGTRTAAGFGRLWNDIAEAFGLDPDGRVLKAVATRDTWSGITLAWPVDGGGRLPVELSGLPTFDRARQFAGYRGFGVCRDLDGLARLAALRRYELFSVPPAPQALSAGIASADLTGLRRPPDGGIVSSVTPESSAPAMLETPIAIETSHQTDLETSVETPKNVVPFRSIGEPKSPVLSPVENSAFNELARQLAERLDGEHDVPVAPAPPETSQGPQNPEAVADQPAATETSGAGAQPDWLNHPEPPARGESRRDKTLLDLLPMGVLIYRLDRLLYANPAFLERMGYHSLQALEEAGGLDALYVEPGVSSASSTSDTGTPVTISAGEAASEQATPSATDARLYTISWDGESALALIFSGVPIRPTESAAAIAETVTEPSPVGHANAEELGAILDTTAEGILMFDAEGNINSCNRSAEALFGHDGGELVQRNLAELFAPESRPAVRDYLESIKGADIASLLEHGRDVLAQVRGGGLIPVSITIGRTQAQGPNFFAVFRDQSQSKKSEGELREAQRLTDRAGNAKADLLARISHEVRTPLNAIIGFAEVMIGERFGALGNERYVEYMKDIRASGERVIAIINDLLDLSRIETGKLDLAFADQNLNDLVEQCVAGMQPQANRERIIIRTSLAHALPPVVADARALRQITLNLIGNSIHLANAGGQVIVSTALSDFGEVVLRVRDTGHGLNDNEVAAAMEPFRTPPPSDQASDSSGVSLSLTKALVEANRAQFQIKTGGRSGTLIEVVFPHAMAKA